MTKRNKIIITQLNDEYFFMVNSVSVKNEDRNNIKKNKRFPNFFRN